MQTGLHIEQILVGPMANFSYLIVDLATKKTCYVDPGWEVDRLLSVARKKGWRIEKILLTHTHFDHCQALEEAVQKLRVPVYVHSLEKERIDVSGMEYVEIKQEEVIPCGQLKIKALWTPGHTPGEICYLVNKSLISGDVLFVGGCGRADLPGSDPKQLGESLRRLGGLSEETRIYPGHDYGSSPTSTIGVEKEKNIFLQSALKSLDDFVRNRI